MSARLKQLLSDFKAELGKVLDEEVSGAFPPPVVVIDFLYSFFTPKGLTVVGRLSGG